MKNKVILVIFFCFILLCSLFFMEEPNKNVENIFINVDSDIDRFEYSFCDIEIEYTDKTKIKYKGHIRGRGNSTWEAEKQPYKLRLQTPLQIEGLYRTNMFVLLANAYDKTYIRNQLGSVLVDCFDNIPYSVHQKNISLYLNDEYIGAYTFGESINRKSLNLPYYSHLVEVGSVKEEGYTYFNTDFFFKQVILKDEIMSKEKELELLNYLNIVEKSIIEGSEEWEKYLNIDNLVDWFIVQEVAANYECSSGSFYLILNDNGEILLGPCWDFDSSFGNMIVFRVNDFVSSYGFSEETLFNYLLKNEKFVLKLQERWVEKKAEIEINLLNYIDSYGVLTEYYQKDIEKWDIFENTRWHISDNVAEIKTYEGQIGYLRDFVIERINVLDKAIMEL